MLVAYKTAKTQINMFLLFDFKTAGQLGCASVRLRGLCFSDYDTLRSLLMRLYRPVLKFHKLCTASFMFIVYWKGALFPKVKK